MNSILTRFRSFVVRACRFSAVFCVATLFVIPPPAAAADLFGLPNLHNIRIQRVSGSAVTTITSLVFLNDVTMAIEAEQVGHLTGFGNFTGHFSYIAVASPATIVLVGSATLTNDQGEQLHVTASILELGADYPRTVNGTLTVTGGTGRYAGATGVIGVSGIDEESPTDTFNFDGTLVTIRGR
jgi:hypothetical protein